MGFKEILKKIKLKNERGIELICPNTNDYILCQYEPRTLTQSEQKSLYEGLQSNFPDNKVIVIPSNINITCLTRDEIINIIKNLQRVLEMNDELYKGGDKHE